jgi:hypothetical protein
VRVVGSCAATPKATKPPAAVEMYMREERSREMRDAERKRVRLAEGMEAKVEVEGTSPIS